VAVVADLLEERWPSMDLVAETLVEELTSTGLASGIRVEMLRPVLTSRRKGVGRFINRFWDYSRWLKSRAGTFDVFHIIDHSYAHLVHALPAERTIVTCHDVDAFLPLVAPGLTRSRLPKLVVRVLLSGMRKAARITCDTAATYDEVCRYRIAAPDRLVVVPNGTPAGYSPRPASEGDASLGRLLGPVSPDVVDLLHVGTTIPRKRIDLLLKIVAAVKSVNPAVRLLKAGGSFTSAQRDLVRQMGLKDHVVQLPFLETAQMAALYRRAGMVLLTSEREGFGLPVIEAMACGTRVIATDLKVLREVGGGAALFCPLGDIHKWRDTILEVMRESHDPTARKMWRAAGIAQARTFSWRKYADSMARIYRSVAAEALADTSANAWANGS
jgi:glycosyltransferase involved in cell wall biosynthesis